MMSCRIRIEARAELTIDADCQPDEAADYVDELNPVNYGDWEITNLEVIEVLHNGSDEEP